MTRRLAGLAGALCAAAVSIVFAQQPAPVSIERILLLVNDDFVTMIDVRQARSLKLVDLSGPSDLEVAMRIVERKLELSEVARGGAKEPGADAVEAHRRKWEATLGGADVQALLRQAGWTAADLTAWLRDDVRIEMYVDHAFGANVAPMRSEVLQYYQQHLPDYTRDGVVRPFEEVSTDVSETLQNGKRVALVKAWAASLVRQADVRPPR